MKKIIVFFLFFNLIFIQNIFAKEEKTIFGFSLEFPSSKYVVLKEQNELTIKEFLKQNGYRYFQTPNPKDVEIRIVDYRFSRINPVDAQPGDVVLWNNDHVNFVYKNINGKKIFSIEVKKF